MLFSEEFLKREVENVTLSLKETLRHEYGTLRIKDFYDECLSRLRAVDDLLNESEKTNLTTLLEVSTTLSDLSALITRIERSHLSEFSWPFANELETLATKVYGSNISTSSFKAPLFFISADGGLSAYGIHPEQNEADVVSDQRIFSIVFPRTLKYHVLLHAILGHELGHAIYSIPYLQEKIKKKVINPLFANSVLSTTEEFKLWMGKHSRSSLHFLNDKVALQIMDSWKEEFFCDLFGLVLMGPSFVAAHKSLLMAADPRGIHPGISEHPPDQARYWLLDMAVNILKLKTLPDSASPAIKKAVSNFWSSMEQTNPYPSWSKMFKKQDIENALKKLKHILNKKGAITYQIGKASNLDELYTRLCKAIPPIRNSINSSSKVCHHPIDFRDILYIGWLGWHTSTKKRIDLSFLDINRLCDRAILQQQAVDIEKAYQEEQRKKKRTDH